MARRVFVHLGLPKTATTYLQTIMWGQRELMRQQGVLLPGAERRDHLWASRIVRGESSSGAQREQKATAWDRLRREIAAWSGDAVISHEFFAAASAEQARAMIAGLAPAEVHLVVTARDPLGLFAASWQESLKNKATLPMAEYARTESDSSRDIWNWRTLDLRLVLERWAPPEGAIAAAHVHVLPLPTSDLPRETIWHRFAGLIGLQSEAFDLGGSFPNESMGVAQSETLRRINEHLDGFNKAFDRGVYIRTYLADERLVPQGGERYWPEDDQIDDCRRRGRLAVDLVRERGFDLIGSIEDLHVPDTLAVRRKPSSVTDAEVADVAVQLVASMLADVRAARGRIRALERQSTAPGVGVIGHVKTRVRRALGR